jgi:hypothetical protein
MPFNTDLKTFRQTSRKGITKMEAWASSYPGQRTDILGMLVVAQQEVVAGTKGSSLFIILSGFLEQDDRWDFETSSAFANPQCARGFAHIEAASLHLALPDTSVYLGRPRTETSEAFQRCVWTPSMHFGKSC